MSLNTPTGCTTPSASIAHPLHHGPVTVRHIDNLKSLVGGISFSVRSVTTWKPT